MRRLHSLDVARAAGRTWSDDAVEAELNRLIERRSRNGDTDPDEREELWKESVKAYHERQRAQNRWAWIRHFDRMAANHRALSEHYERRAEELCEDKPRGA